MTTSAPRPSAQAWQARKRTHLALAEAAAATYDADYAQTAFATACYMDFEEEALRRAAADAPSGGLALDLGCGTGRLAAVLGERFGRVWGCDLSPKMVAEARQRSLPGVVARYDVFDVDGNALPFGPNRADLINAGFGLFSFVEDPRSFLRDAARVLRPGGGLVLSCYNAGVVPVPSGAGWSPALHARVGGGGVRVTHGGDQLEINAKAYDRAGVRALLAADFEVEAIVALPTLATLLPAALVEDPRVRALCAAADAAVAEREDLCLGAYLWVHARRRSRVGRPTDRPAVGERANATSSPVVRCVS